MYPLLLMLTGFSIIKLQYFNGFKLKFDLDVSFLGFWFKQVHHLSSFDYSGKASFLFCDFRKSLWTAVTS